MRIWIGSGIWIRCCSPHGAKRNAGRAAPDCATLHPGYEGDGHSRKCTLRNPAACIVPIVTTEDNTMKRAALMLMSALWLAVGVAAQDKYPSRPIKVLVPYAPGGAVDIVA